VPRALPETQIFNGIKLTATSFKDGEQRLIITNFKVAKGGLDLRRTLLSEGSVSTTEGKAQNRRVVFTRQ